MEYTLRGRDGALSLLYSFLLASDLTATLDHNGKASAEDGRAEKKESRS